MIGALIEGVQQSILPCSWVILMPAILVGAGTGPFRVLASFAVSAGLFVWIMVAGWIVLPVWVAGLALATGAVLWWSRGLTWSVAALIGAGSAWAWQPCVGEQLGKALNTAQHDPLGALPGLMAFILGAALVGLVLGRGVRMLAGHRLTGHGRIYGPALVAVLGLTMVVGLYGRVASVLARWSTSLWSSL